MLPYGLDSSDTKLLANLLTKPSAFYYFLPIEFCNLVAVKIIIIIIIIYILIEREDCYREFIRNKILHSII